MVGKWWWWDKMGGGVVGWDGGWSGGIKCNVEWWKQKWC